MSREGEAPIMANPADSEKVSPLSKQTKLILLMDIIFIQKLHAIYNLRGSMEEVLTTV
jgi:hypothetical protein